MANIQIIYWAIRNPQENVRIVTYWSQSHVKVLQQGTKEPNRSKIVRKKAEVHDLKIKGSFINGRVIKVCMDGIRTKAEHLELKEKTFA